MIHEHLDPDDPRRCLTGENLTAYYADRAAAECARADEAEREEHVTRLERDSLLEERAALKKSIGLHETMVDTLAKKLQRARARGR